MHNELKAHRIMNGYSQKDMAKVIGRTRDTYRRSESGQREFDLDEAGKISKFLQVPIDVLFPGAFYIDDKEGA